MTPGEQAAPAPAAAAQARKLDVAIEANLRGLGFIEKERL